MLAAVSGDKAGGGSRVTCGASGDYTFRYRSRKREITPEKSLAAFCLRSAEERDPTSVSLDAAEAFSKRGGGRRVPEFGRRGVR